MGKNENDHGMDAIPPLALIEDDPFKRLAHQFFAKPGAVVKIPVGLENYNSKRETSFNRGANNAVKQWIKEGQYCRCIICYSMIPQCGTNEKPNKPGNKNESFDLLEFLKTLVLPMDIPNLTSVSVLFEKAITLLATSPFSCLCQLCSDACENFLFQHRAISKLKREVSETHLKFMAAIRLSAELSDEESKSGYDSETYVTSDSISAVNTVRKCLNKGKSYAPDSTEEDTIFKNTQIRCSSPEPEPVKNCDSDREKSDEEENYDELNNAIDIKTEKVEDCNSTCLEERDDETTLLTTDTTTLPTPPSFSPRPSENGSFEQHSSTTSTQDSNSDDSNSNYSNSDYSNSDDSSSDDNKSDDSNFDDDVTGKTNVKRKLVIKKKASGQSRVSTTTQETTIISKLHKCNYCPQTFTEGWNLNRHIRKLHKSERHLACPHCPARFSYSLPLTQHINSKHKERHACDLCPKTFIRRSELVSHRNVHTNSPQFACHQCPKRYYTRKGLKDHLLSVHPTPGNKVKKLKLECNICGTYYSYKATLRKHKRIFHGAGPVIVCEHCGRKFTTAHDMDNHLRTHTGERPFACHLCTMTYKDKYTLKGHIRLTHLRDSPHKCEKCGKCYLRKKKLLSHVNTTQRQESL